MSRAGGVGGGRGGGAGGGVGSEGRGGRAVARRTFDALDRLLGGIGGGGGGDGGGRDRGGRDRGGGGSEAGRGAAGGLREVALFSAAGRLGWLRNRLSAAWPSPQQVGALFPWLDRRDAARVAWEIGALEGRNRLLVELLRRRGSDAVRPLVRVPAAWESLRPPLILCTFHLGAMQALGAALERLPAPVLAFRLGVLGRARPPLEIVSSMGGEEARAAAFLRALDRLRHGGFVAMAIDLPAAEGAGGEVAAAATCLGHALKLARGPFALARLSGAPLVPTVARWRKHRIEIAIDDPWPAPPGDESAPAAAAGRWLDRYLRAAPADLGLGLLRALLAAGAAGTSVPGEGSSGGPLPPGAR